MVESGMKKILYLFSLRLGRLLQAIARSRLLVLGLLVMPSAALGTITIDEGETFTNPTATILTNDSWLKNNGTLTNDGTLADFPFTRS